MKVSGRGHVGGAGGCPTIRAGIVSPASVQKKLVIFSTPNDHFTASPHGSVQLTDGRRISGAGGCPTIRAGIVSPAGVQDGRSIPSTPDDHFTTGPNGCVTCAGRGDMEGARSPPLICARVGNFRQSIDNLP